MKCDLTIEECECPGKICSSGHVASGMFQEKPIRFFKISGLISGIYCEPCLIVANYIAKEGKDVL